MAVGFDKILNTYKKVKSKNPEYSEIKTLKSIYGEYNGGGVNRWKWKGKSYKGTAMEANDNELIQYYTGEKQ
jgi:hypothetical protein